MAFQGRRYPWLALLFHELVDQADNAIFHPRFERPVETEFLFMDFHQLNK